MKKKSPQSTVRSPQSRAQDSGLRTQDLFAVGQRVYLAVAGYPISQLRSPNSHIFLPKGARGVVTQADPTGDILTIQFDLASGPVAGLRLPVTHVCKINHDVQPPSHD